MIRSGDLGCCGNCGHPTYKQPAPGAWQCIVCTRDGRIPVRNAKPTVQPSPVGGRVIKTERKRRDWPVVVALLALWIGGYVAGFANGYMATHPKTQVHIKRVMV